MENDGKLFLGGPAPQYLDLKRANRHGLVAGATGTGKTVTLRVLAEGFSAAGVPVFVPDIKGDLSGIGHAGSAAGKAFLTERAAAIGYADAYRFEGFPTIHWDIRGKLGHPVRTSISEMGPLLLSRLLGLNDTQSGVLAACFKLADDEGLLLLDLKDLKAILNYAAENAAALRGNYGNISAASVGAIQRGLLALESEGGEMLFGEPALDLKDFMRTVDGRGVINLLSATQVIQSPRLYATFLLWLLSELFEELPEVGDPDKPKLVFFFDEAHLLFNDAPKALVDKVTQVVRLIRSKGVGVYFVTQSPADIPDEILGQLGNRIQHALRAYTPGERKAVKAAADSFRPNPAFKTEEAITELGVGEALVSTLDAKGVPGIVERTLIRPPSSALDPIDERTRAAAIAASPVAGLYDKAIDRDSAYERLNEKASREAAAEAREKEGKARAKSSPWGGPAPARSRTSRSDSLFETTAKSVLRTAGRELVRGLLGSLLKRR